MDLKQAGGRLGRPPYYTHALLSLYYCQSRGTSLIRNSIWGVTWSRPAAASRSCDPRACTCTGYEVMIQDLLKSTIFNRRFLERNRRI